MTPRRSLRLSLKKECLAQSSKQLTPTSKKSNIPKAKKKQLKNPGKSTTSETRYLFIYFINSFMKKDNYLPFTNNSISVRSCPIELFAIQT